MSTEAIVWGCLAIGLIALEVMAPGVFMLWLGVAAGVVMALVLLMPGKLSLLWQAVAFAGISVALIPLYRHFLGRHDAPTDSPLLNKRSGQLVGQVFPLEAAIVSGHGRIKVGDALWTVTGPELPAGTRVRVTGADAMVLQVVPE
jgi:membrane protein implicated in regulation of membrane protease activity